MSDPRPENPWLRWGLLGAVMVATGIWWYLDPNPGAAEPAASATDGVEVVAGDAAQSASDPAAEAAAKKAEAERVAANQRRLGAERKSRHDRRKARRSSRSKASKKGKERSKSAKVEVTSDKAPGVATPRGNGQEPASPDEKAELAAGSKSKSPAPTPPSGVPNRVGGEPSSTNAKLQQARGPPASANATPKIRHKVQGVRVLNYGKVFWSGTMDLSATIARIKAGKRHSHRNDGSVFGNRERRLPTKRRGYYREYVHPTEGIRGPGPQRLVVGQGGEWYYTPDHYESFIPLHTTTGRGARP